MNNDVYVCERERELRDIVREYENKGESVYEREKYCEGDSERGRACDRVKKIERE